MTALPPLTPTELVEAFYAQLKAAGQRETPVRFQVEELVEKVIECCAQTVERPPLKAVAPSQREAYRTVGAALAQTLRTLKDLRPRPSKLYLLLGGTHPMRKYWRLKHVPGQPYHDVVGEDALRGHDPSHCVLVLFPGWEKTSEAQSDAFKDLRSRTDHCILVR